ncbi:MAG: DUF411 domain-containing protein [Woeseiaceae bacterium]|nr:DUF411 domain-containing protein [Woeseiaceae bacterium]
MVRQILRRQALIGFSFTLLLGFFLTSPAWADEPADDEPKHVVVHKNPGCACCDVWADHLRSHGFTVESTEDPSILEFKAERNIPGPLMSCHTAVVDGYFVEGHVPANDILRLLKEKPGYVTGIAVPGMPLGSPGMEHPRPQDFNTIALLLDGSAYVFESHVAGEDFSAQ